MPNVFAISCSLMFAVALGSAIYATAAFTTAISKSPDCDAECQAMLNRVYFGDQILLNQSNYNYIDLQTFKPPFRNAITGDKVKLKDTLWIDDTF